MWVKRTTQELVELKLKKKRSRLRGAIFSGILIFGFVLLFRATAPEGVPHLASRYELPSRGPFALLCGLVVAIFYYILPPRSRQIVVCNHCGKSKDKDSETKCSCGGTFEDIRTMKWQEEY
jgi:hypothetical protein